MKPLHVTFRAFHHTTALRPGSPRLMAIWPMVLVLALLLLLAGCGSPGTATSAATTPPPSAAASGTTAGASGQSGTGSTTASPPTSLSESGRYGQQLMETSQAAAALGDQLEKKDAKDPDLVAQIYGLRARSQAIVAVRALLQKEPQLADDAVLQMRQLLNRAVGSGSTTWSELLAKALSQANQIPAPSTDGATARAQLDAVSADLAPLVPVSSSGSGS